MQAARTIEREPRDVHVDGLVPWPKNPRKTLGDLESLTAAVREQGVLQRLLVRPNTGRGGGFEIICGERRWHAAKAAGLATVPVDVTEDLDDDEDALEASIAENIQRADVHPLEEADGLAELRERGRTVEEIAARIGRPTSYVYRRLALTSLCGDARDLLVAEQLSLAGAELLARLSDVEAQTEAAAWARQQYEVPGVPVSPMALRWAINRATLDLARAPWALDDVELVAGVGPCTTCPKRTGAQALLFGDAAEEDRCTDRACFGAKRTAHGDRVIALAKKDGAKVMPAAEAKKLLSSEYAASNAYTLEADGYYNLDNAIAPAAKKTWRAVLGDRSVERIVARNPHSGEVHELVRKKDVARVLKKDPRKGDPGSEKGKGTKGSKSKSGSKGTSAKAAKKTREQLVDQARREGAWPRILAALVEAIEKGKLPLLEALRFIVEEISMNLGSAEAATRRGAKGNQEMAAWIAAQTKPGPLAACAVECVLSDCVYGEHYDFKPDSEGRGSWEQRLVEAAGVDWLAIEQEEIAIATAEPGTCRVCGCTEEDACDGGCTWVDESELRPHAPPKTLCDRCAAQAKPAKKSTAKKARAR